MKIFSAVVGDTTAFEVEIDEGESVSALKKTIKEANPASITCDPKDLELFVGRKDNSWVTMKSVLTNAIDTSNLMRMDPPDMPILFFKLSEAVDVRRRLDWDQLRAREGPVAVLVEIPEDTEWKKLLGTLEWKEPRCLCWSSGCNWPCQGASELAEALKSSLVDHYNAWQQRSWDKQTHTLNLVLSGPGTGKSRMLDEMKDLLCAAAVGSKNQTLIQRIKSAYVFHVTFENGTSPKGQLLDRDAPDLDISYRMLYQLSNGEMSWEQFAATLRNLSPSCIFIETVVEILQELEGIDDLKKMTVILCVDGLQRHSDDGTKSSDFYRVMTSVCNFLNSSKAFAV